jgi:hypothetical protein
MPWSFFMKIIVIDNVGEKGLQKLLTDNGYSKEDVKLCDSTFGFKRAYTAEVVAVVVLPRFNNDCSIYDYWYEISAHLKDQRSDAALFVVTPGQDLPLPPDELTGKTEKKTRNPHIVSSENLLSELGKIVPPRNAGMLAQPVKSATAGLQ